MKNIFRSLSLALLATTGAFAAAPATNAPPAAPASPAKVAAPPAQSGSILDDYIKDLAATLKLTDDEKKTITGYYTADGDVLKKILNNEELSPLEQARQVSDLRDTRNAKIEKLLQDVDRQHDFPGIEAKYRVALTEFAADGGLAPAEPAPAPAAK